MFCTDVSFSALMLGLVTGKMSAPLIPKDSLYWKTHSNLEKKADDG